MTDEQSLAWNACLARGDEAEIETMRNNLLNGIFTKIMNEDTNYHVAGWTTDRKDAA